MKIFLYALSLLLMFANVKCFLVSCFGYILEDYGTTGLPKTKNAKCMYECMMSSSEMTKWDGLINVEKLVNFLKAQNKFDSGTLTKIVGAVEKCKNHKHLSEDKCETVALFVQCAAEEGAKNGLDQSVLLNAIRQPFTVQNDRSIKRWLFLGQLIGLNFIKDHNY